MLGSAPAAPSPVRVSKFGGTSVGTPERVRDVVRLVQEGPADARHLVVVSAFGGVTDRLLEALAAAERRAGTHTEVLAELQQRHTEAIETLVLPGERAAVRDAVDAVFANVAELLHGVYLLRECTPRFRDTVLSAGERASAPVVAAAFRAAGLPAEAWDAREVVRTDSQFGEANVDFPATRALARTRWGAVPAGTVPVVTGFIGTDAGGVTTTLGRSGSDYTATILGWALDAVEVVIWTDVDGVLSADPRLVQDAFTLERLSYEEAAELAHFGAKVLHPRTMRPLVEGGIPLRIKNTMRPGAPGTRVGAAEGAGPGHIKAVTALREAALVTLRGDGSDLAPRAFAALAAAGVPTVLAAQASSEGNVCLAVRAARADEARAAIEKAFARERERDGFPRIEVVPGVAIVAGVGRDMREAPGLAGRMFNTLGRAHVNVLAIAQGASQTSIAAAVREGDTAPAVRALHEAFALRRQRAHVFVIGTGTLGQKWLRLFEQQAAALLEAQRLHFVLVGVANVSGWVLDEDGLAADAAIIRLDAPTGTGLAALSERLRAARLERLIVVDATASDEVAARYPEWLAAGIAVVTPNKQASAGPADRYRAVCDAARDAETPYLYETTVGAGLSVVSTLRDLVRTGDAVRRIEGVLSGTLAFVFNALRRGSAFSEAVRRAIAEGYAEPDPRDDLSGRDVARKLTILAREAGLEVDEGAAQVQSLVPPPFREGTPEAFLARLPELDAYWRKRVEEFRASGRELQYVAVLTRAGIRAGVQALAPDAPLAGLEGPALAVAFHTERYGERPLVVQGPGASADTTAAVLLADVVRAAERMR